MWHGAVSRVPRIARSTWPGLSRCWLNDWTRSVCIPMQVVWWSAWHRCLLKEWKSMPLYLKIQSKSSVWRVAPFASLTLTISPIVPPPELYSLEIPNFLLLPEPTLLFHIPRLPTLCPSAWYVSVTMKPALYHHHPYAQLTRLWVFKNALKMSFIACLILKCNASFQPSLSPLPDNARYLTAGVMPHSSL